MLSTIVNRSATRRGYLIPGMRNVARRLRCIQADCGREGRRAFDGIHLRHTQVRGLLPSNNRSSLANLRALLLQVVLWNFSARSSGDPRELKASCLRCSALEHSSYVLVAQPHQAERDSKHFGHLYLWYDLLSWCPETNGRQHM